MRLFPGLLSFVLVLFFVSCTKKKSPVPIPADAEVIARINSKEIITQIAKEKLTDFSLDDLFSTSEQDTTRKKRGLGVILEDPSEAGIDLLEEVWAFYKNSEIGIIASIEDADELKEAITKNITKDIFHSEKLDAFTGKKISAVWNKEYVLFLISEKPVSEKYLFSLLSTERHLFNSPVLEKDGDKEILIWNNNNYLRNFLPVPFQAIIGADSFSLTTIDFEDGKMEVKNETLLSNRTRIFKPVSFNPDLVNQEDLLNLAFTIDLTSLPAKNLRFSNSYINNCLNGSLYLKIDSIKSQAKIFKSIEVDDEFNTVEKIDTTLEYYPSFILLAPVKNEDSCHSLLRTLENKGLLIKEDTGYKATLSYFPINIQIKSHALKISSSVNKSIDGTDSEHSLSCFLFLTIHNNSASNTIKDYLPSSLEKITFTLLPDSNNYIKIEGSIETTQKEEYSLLTLIDIFKSKSSSFIMEESKTIQ